MFGRTWIIKLVYLKKKKRTDDFIPLSSIVKHVRLDLLIRLLVSMRCSSSSWKYWQKGGLLCDLYHIQWKLPSWFTQNQMLTYQNWCEPHWFKWPVILFWWDSKFEAEGNLVVKIGKKFIHCVLFHTWVSLSKESLLSSFIWAPVRILSMYQFLSLGPIGEKFWTCENYFLGSKILSNEF